MFEKDGNILRTCALRPAGIYGEGEKRHLPRIVVRVGRADSLFSCTKLSIKAEDIATDFTEQQQSQYIELGDQTTDTVCSLTSLPRDASKNLVVAL